MPILNDRLSALLNQRKAWMSMNAKVHGENIAFADLPGAKRKEMKSFINILKHSDRARMITGKKLIDVKDVQISEKSVHQTNDEIVKELEMLLLTKNTTEHDGLISLIKSFRHMFKAVLSKN